MASKLRFFLWVLLFFSINLNFCQSQQLYFNGFNHANGNITLNGVAKIENNGVLQLTNATTRLVGHAFYPSPIRVKSSSNGKAVSFSTVFAFAMVPEFQTLGGHGLAFTFSPSKDIPGALPSQYLGLFNASNIGNLTDHIFAIEFDEVQDFEFKDINDNHVGVNINSLISNASVPAAYFIDGNSTAQNFNMKSGKTILAWIDYDSSKNHLNISLSLSSDRKPDRSILSYNVDLSPYLNEFMYVGFSASTGLLASSHYIMGWSFKVNGDQATPLDLSSLPTLPRPKKSDFGLVLGSSMASIIVFFVAVGLAIYVVWWYKNRDVIEPWELDIGPHRFPYKELKKATRGFKDKQLLGFGGFGRVYKGTLPNSNTQVAVKRISHESRQGLKEFVAEIASIGRLRHRNLVQLLGWCRRRGDLIIVYDYMPNGSLDKYLFDEPQKVLNWDQRFKIIKGVASGLLYLHEGWEQTVIHRDIKAGNVLLDADLNGKLGDFGLAKLYEHGSNPSTTRVVGTLGYLAPELTRTGKPTPSSDVFAFGALLLEVACGRKPIEPKALPEELILVDWVWDRWKAGAILDVMDSKLKGEYDEIEAIVVLKLGLMCSTEDPEARPTMRQVVRYLEGELALPVEVTMPPPGGGNKGGKKGGGGEDSRREKSSGEFEDYLHSYSAASYMDIEGGSGSLLSLSGGNEGR